MKYLLNPGSGSYLMPIDEVMKIMYEVSPELVRRYIGYMEIENSDQFYIYKSNKKIFKL